MPVFSFTSSPESAFFRVVRAGWVAGCGTDAAIVFVNEVCRGKVFAAAIAPLIADALVKTLGEGFCEAVCDGLSHDGVVIVVLGFELLDEFFEAEAAGDGEAADVVSEAGFFRRDEVGKRAAGFLAAMVGLLTEVVEDGEDV